MSLMPSDFLYFPIRNGEWLRDSQGKPRVYKSAKAAYNNLKKQQYDAILVYAVDDIVIREEFEKAVRNNDKKRSGNHISLHRLSCRRYG